MDYDNPFAAGADRMATPSGGPLPVGGRVDLVAALRDGTMHALRNILPLTGGFLVAFTVYLVSVCTCVGWIVAAPFLLRGMNRFMLSIVDGKPDFGVFSEGLSPAPTEVFLRGWGILLILFVLILPSMGVAIAVQVAQDSGQVSAAVGLVVSNVASLLWGAAIAPLTYASYVWADRSLGVIASYKGAFETFRPSWPALVGLLAATQVVLLPSSLLGPYVQELATAAPLAPSPEGLSAMIALTLLMYAGLAAGLGVSMCWAATAYRQVVPAQSLDALSVDAGPTQR